MSHLLQRLRVPVGFGYAAALLYFAESQVWSFGSGLTIALVGLSIRLWASGHLKRGEQLAVTGPYARTRNPLYLGSFLMGLGFSVASGRPWFITSFVTLFLLVYLPVMRREENELLQSFGNHFLAYRQHVPFFVPRLGASSPISSSNFRWQQVILNREHKTILGFIVFAALVWIKSLWQ